MCSGLVLCNPGIIEDFVNDLIDKPIFYSIKNYIIRLHFNTKKRNKKEPFDGLFFMELETYRS